MKEETYVRGGVSRAVVDSCPNFLDRRVFEEFAKICNAYEYGTNISGCQTVTQPFKGRDVRIIRGVPVPRPLPVSKPSGLDQPMSGETVRGVVDHGGSRPRFKYFESRKHDGTGGRGNGGVNAVPAIGDVDRRPGERGVVPKVLQGYDPATCLDR